MIFPDESVSVKNEEEAESSGEEGAAHADFIDGDSNLTMRLLLLIIYDDYNDSHHNMCRAKFLSELEGGCFILKRDDPSVQWQRDYGCHT